LIHLEQAWAENKFTAEGRVMHANAHEGPDETRAGVRITRGMPVASMELGMTGQCDVVEFDADKRVLPVEYKRGKPKSHRADEIQLCAQAMCLEEMLGIAIERGCLYYGEKRRRTDVFFDGELRELVLKVIGEVRQCFASGITPTAEYEARRCDACSLIELCQPQAMRFKKGVAAWFSTHLKSPI
jgi:CRISPR-associated exonuclease Cas4